MIDPNISRRLMTIAYVTSLLLLTAYTIWLYAVGHYDFFFISAFSTLLALSALLMHIGQGVNSYVPRLVLLGCLYLIVSQAALEPSSNTSPLWFGLPIAASMIFLPLIPALGLNILLLPAWWWLLAQPGDQKNWESIITLLLLLALPRWEHLRRQALLYATDPNDSECNAYQSDALKNRLRNEYQRSSVLGNRLAVLVIHLPQFDMAGEQFGRKAQLALLETLCEEVNESCRDHDLLGRASQATFWLVLPDTSESGALLVRERLKRSLSRCVLVETGQLVADIVAYLPRRQEFFHLFIQRLEERSHALANSLPETTT
ncbi:MAG: diguanylate cyclase domain-containing protein [Pseudomonadota bacterium]